MLVAGKLSLSTLEFTSNLPDCSRDSEGQEVPQSSLNNISFSEILLGVSKSKSLTSLIFKNNGITSASMKLMNVVMRYNKVLTSIDFSHNPLGDRGAHLLFTKIARNQKILDIRLVNIGMTDVGAREVAKFLCKFYPS